MALRRGEAPSSLKGRVIGVRQHHPYTVWWRGLCARLSPQPEDFTGKLFRLPKLFRPAIGGCGA